MIWPFNRKLEPVAAEYLAACKQGVPKGVDVADLTVLVIDAETTGFSLDNDRLLSLATIEVAEREIHVRSAKDWLIYQNVAPVNEAMKVHGILPSDTAKGRPEKEVLGEFLKSLGSRLLVGHHIKFDAGMLSVAVKRHYGIKLRGRVLDTALLAMQELPAFHKTGYANQKPPSLEDVCTSLNLPMMDRHTAAGDAFTTAAIFLALCARLRKRLERPVRLEDLPVTKF
ncbi:3'-5' exonuclease [Pelagicoccus albus]|uniref:3'-5' exonuclease n=1 Tax=Pelagicoccus albus TaxID=415222 RepID=A0A7X1B4Y8_9BACT|nr:3'-5' exonuclease [Pelagicoccus albus]MBC2605695.1 3'-5' exonuclease [Pelagicoccus albus]